MKNEPGVQAFIALLIALCGAPASSLVAQEELPPLEVMMKEAEGQLVAQHDAIERTVNTALAVFRSKSRTVSNAARADERKRLLALGPAAVPSLMDALAKSETSAKVLDQIGMVLESINDPSIFPQLRDLALSDQPHRAATAIGLLGSFKDKKSASTLRLLAVNEKSAKVRAAALVALAQLADEEAATLAQKALVANKFRVRIAAVQVFGMIGRAPDAKLLEALVADEKAEVVVATVLALGDLVERTKVSRGLALIHSALKAKNKSVVMVAIEQTERVGSRDISVKHLQGVMARNKEDASRGLRKRAAIALFRMGDTGGLESYAKPLELAAKRNPKRSQNQWRLLSELYWEFRDYKACLRSTTKYANFDLNFLDLDKMRMRMARCQSRLGKFKRAYDLIEKAKGTTSWPELADDEDFAAMRKQSRYRKNFANPEPK